MKSSRSLKIWSNVDTCIHIGLLWTFYLIFSTNWKGSGVILILLCWSEIKKSLLSCSINTTVLLLLINVYWAINNMLGTVSVALSVDYLIYLHRHFYFFLLTLSELEVVKDALYWSHKSQQLVKKIINGPVPSQYISISYQNYLLIFWLPH